MHYVKVIFKIVVVPKNNVIDIEKSILRDICKVFAL